MMSRCMTHSVRGLRRGFTLIEMLIVVAILSIITASLISYIQMPPREQLQATTDVAIEQGLAACFSKLVADAHNATELRMTPDGRGLIAENSGEGSSAVYYVDADQTLRRAIASEAQAEQARGGALDWQAGLQGAMIARRVERFEAAPAATSGMWTIVVSVETGDEGHAPLERRVDVAVRGGAQ